MNWLITTVVLLFLVIVFHRRLRFIWRLFVIVGSTVPGPIKSLFNRVSRAVSMELSSYLDGDGNDQPLRIYHPATAGECAAFILYPGASPAGEEHEAVNELALALARGGFRVFLPRIPELKKVLIRQESINHIIRVYEAVSGRQDVDATRIAAVGMSFGGSLMVKACCDKRMIVKPAVVLSYGSFFDFEKTLEFVLTGNFSDGINDYHLEPHEWGRVGFFHNFIQYVDGDFDFNNVQSYLLTCAGAEEDKVLAAYSDLSRKDQRFVDKILKDSDLETQKLAQETLAKVRATIEPLSPRSFLDRIDFPLFLMHGANDTMVPFTETVMFDRALRERGKQVDTFISYLYAHSEVTEHSKGYIGFIREAWKIGVFMSRLLGKLV
ncbi:MAG: prolyl oligopeptidase family serine peptidase [Candidatus Marinimicrobia bacterium]|jgi:acetyl esterase/lipase|nr:prolyl oligopeptidase family serine peptidase [Candidatus Neomarinimicrobiota bacterium]